MRRAKTSKCASNRLKAHHPSLRSPCHLVTLSPLHANPSATIPSLHIALVILHADPARGGAERYTADLAAALAARGHAVSILATDFGPAIDGVEFIPVSSRAATRRGRYARFLKSLDRNLAEKTYDVVHAMLPVRRCDLYHPHAGLAAEAMATGHKKYAGRVSQAASRIGNQLNPRRRLMAEVERDLLTGSRPPVLLCLSELVKQIVGNHYALPAEKLATLFNGVDLNRFDPAPDQRQRDRSELAIADDRIAVLMVAQNFGLKGLKEAILALAELADPRLLLLVAGRDKPEAYEHLARSRGIGAQVRFLGQVPDPCPLYRAADFLVLPTRRDSCSLAVLEALAMGLPVISTRANGACEIMQDGRHGYVLADPRAVPALADAMRKLLVPAARQSMRQACLDLRPRLSSDAHVDRLLEIYASCKSLSQKSTAC
jgi:UDP-glucose:(heptosyl)LPS alpha-1,3-glucosyltransferase